MIGLICFLPLNDERLRPPEKCTAFQDKQRELNSECLPGNARVSKLCCDDLFNSTSELSEVSG